MEEKSAEVNAGLESFKKRLSIIGEFVMFSGAKFLSSIFFSFDVEFYIHLTDSVAEYRTISIWLIPDYSLILNFEREKSSFGSGLRILPSKTN